MIYYRGAWIKKDLGYYWWNSRRYLNLMQAKAAVDNAYYYLKQSIK